MNKTVKLATVLSLSTLILFACSDAKEKGEDNEQTSPTIFQGVDFNAIYAMDDNKTLVSIGDKKLTVAEVKKKSFEQALVTTINQFIDANLLMQKYPVTKEEVDAEFTRQKELLGENFNAASFNKESVRYQLAYNKAINDLVDYTEEDLKTIYAQYYEGKDTRTFEEMKAEIEKQAPYILGGQKVYEFQQSLRKEATITFNEETLQQQFDLSTNPMVVPQEKPSN